MERTVQGKVMWKTQQLARALTAGQAQIWGVPPPGLGEKQTGSAWW